MSNLELVDRRRRVDGVAIVLSRKSNRSFESLYKLLRGYGSSWSSTLGELPFTETKLRVEAM